MVSMFFLCDEFLPFGDQKTTFLVNFLHCSKLGLCVLNCPICQLLQGFEYSRKSLNSLYDGQLDGALA